MSVTYNSDTIKYNISKYYSTCSKYYDILNPSPGYVAMTVDPLRRKGEGSQFLIAKMKM